MIAIIVTTNIICHHHHFHWCHLTDGAGWSWRLLRFAVIASCTLRRSLSRSRDCNSLFSSIDKTLGPIENQIQIESKDFKHENLEIMLLQWTFKSNDGNIFRMILSLKELFLIQWCHDLPAFSKLRSHPQTKFMAWKLQWTAVNQTQSQHFGCFIQKIVLGSILIF